MIQETSRDAFVSFVLSHNANQHDIILSLLKKHGNMTNKEIARQLNWDTGTVSGRMNELVHDMRLVTEACKRPCAISGRKVIAWEIIKETLF